MKTHLQYVVLLILTLSGLIYSIGTNHSLRNIPPPPSFEMRKSMLPMRGIVNGRESTIDYSRQTTVLCVFLPQQLKPGPLVDGWNDLASVVPSQMMGIMVSVKTFKEPQTELLRFPLATGVSNSDLLRNGMGLAPLTVVVSRGGQVRGHWYGVLNHEKLADVKAALH